MSRLPSRMDQLEAKAHIEVQRMIDDGKAPTPALSTDFILWVHGEFCERLPNDLLWVENPDTGERLPVAPGELRQRRVGRHVPPDPQELPAFLGRFVASYSSNHLSKLRKIVAVAASHHRLAWIHPFLDGNGRVMRLFSHAWLRELGVGSEIWLVTRAVSPATSLTTRPSSWQQMSLGGTTWTARGNLTQAALEDFSRFFLTTCVDQVTFMEKLLEPAELLSRIEIWSAEEVRAKRLPKESWPLLREAVIAGEFGRGREAELTGYEARQACNVLNTLIREGYLTSENSRAPVKLGFPIAVLDRWFPRLYVAVPS